MVLFSVGKKVALFPAHKTGLMFPNFLSFVLFIGNCLVRTMDRDGA